MSIDLGYKITAFTKNAKRVIGGDANISFPTMKFDVKKSLLNSVYKLDLNVYGLSDEEESNVQIDLYKDILDYNGEYEVDVEVNVLDKTFSLFNGFVKECYSVKEAGIVWNTFFMCTNYGYSVSDGLASVSLSSNATMLDLTRELTNKMQGITLNPKDIPIELSTQFIGGRGANLTGNPLEILQEKLPDYKVYIEDKNIKMKKEADIVASEQVNNISIPTLNLISTLRKQNAYYICKSYFRPDINQLGMIIKIENNIYRVMGVYHSGTISPTISNECFTSFELYKL